jgi:hypothetical protein
MITRAEAQLAMAMVMAMVMAMAMAMVMAMRAASHPQYANRASLSRQLCASMKPIVNLSILMVKL